VAYLGLHLHWSYEALMNMEHRERRQWVREVNRLKAPPE
jgi:hypothetical protein